MSMSTKTIVVVSGFFDPIGVQHVILFEEAKKLGDELIIGVNSDECGKMKKGQPCFQTFEERVYICKALRVADQVVGFEDDDIGSACLLLRDVCKQYEKEIENGEVKIIFANGGDRAPDQHACPEVVYAEKYLNNKVEFVYGVGGYHKAGSSSKNLRDWVNNTMIRYGVEFRLDKKY